MSLKKQRDRMIEDAVRHRIMMYVNGSKHRACFSCDAKFNPRHRYHFFCCGECRGDWYSGQFVRCAERGAQYRRVA